MIYSILGFSQSKLIETDLDLTEILLLKYILQACGTPKMKHILDDDEHPLVWIQHKKLSEDLPILKLSEGVLRNKLLKLKQQGYIQSKTLANEGIRGTRTYYGLTEKTMSLIYDVNTNQNENTSLQNDMIETSRHSTMTSNNLLNNDNILKENTISKDIVANAHTEESSSNPLSDYEQHMFSDDVKKRRKIIQQENTSEEKPKKKRKNRWEQCADIVYEYTQDEELRKLLLDYLTMRLQMKERNMFPNQWKLLVHKLDEIGGDPIQIVKQSIEKGWASFYEVKQTSYYNRNAKPDPAIFGEYEEMSCEKVSKEKREELLKNGKKF